MCVVSLCTGEFRPDSLALFLDLVAFAHRTTIGDPKFVPECQDRIEEIQTKRFGRQTLANITDVRVVALGLYMTEVSKQARGVLCRIAHTDSCTTDRSLTF
jgi:hypothetical protein